MRSEELAMRNCFHNNALAKRDHVLTALVGVCWLQSVAQALMRNGLWDAVGLIVLVTLLLTPVMVYSRRLTWLVPLYFLGGIAYTLLETGAPSGLAWPQLVQLATWGALALLVVLRSLSSARL